MKKCLFTALFLSSLVNCTAAEPMAAAAPAEEAFTVSIEGQEPFSLTTKRSTLEKLGMIKSSFEQFPDDKNVALRGDFPREYFEKFIRFLEIEHNDSYKDSLLKHTFIENCTFDEIQSFAHYAQSLLLQEERRYKTLILQAAEFPDRTIKIVPLLRELAQLKKSLTMKNWGMVGCATLGTYVIGKLSNFSTKPALLGASCVGYLSYVLIRNYDSNIRKINTIAQSMLSKLSGDCYDFHILTSIDYFINFDKFIEQLLYPLDTRIVLRNEINPLLADLEKTLTDLGHPRSDTIKKALAITTHFANLMLTPEQKRTYNNFLRLRAERWNA